MYKYQQPTKLNYTGVLGVLAVIAISIGVFFLLFQVFKKLTNSQGKRPSNAQGKRPSNVSPRQSSNKISTTQYKCKKNSDCDTIVGSECKNGTCSDPYYLDD